MDVEVRNAYTIVFKNLRGRDHLRDIFVGGGIILNCVLDE
jgi:hypothetical protein